MRWARTAIAAPAAGIVRRAEGAVAFTLSGAQRPGRMLPSGVPLPEVPGATAIARFVGVEVYEAAGGTVMGDLFADEYEHGVWFEDPVLLEKLTMSKLQAAADELATRWKWAVPVIETAWDDTARYGRIEPQPAERS